MSRFYSLQAKKKYTSDMKKYGFIPKRVSLVKAVKNPYRDFDKCEVDTNTCGCCNSPKNGFYAVYEDSCCDAIAMYVCGRCARKFAYMNELNLQLYYASYTNFAQYHRLRNSKENERICSACGAVYKSDVCPCNLECDCPF